MKQGIRIIAGKYKGKKLQVPISEGLRPTGDRMRETLFNWLMHDLKGARCLDAFAGSGALGFEALSRGASEVVMLENNRDIARLLKKTAVDIGGEGLSIIHQDALSYLNNCSIPFDLVFIDPPFAQSYWQPCLEILEESALLLPGAKIYLESPFEITLNEQQWERLKFKKSGQVMYALYQYNNANS